jgi:hypothetical protein
VAAGLSSYARLRQPELSLYLLAARLQAASHASGGGGDAALAREAAAHGMGVEQYRAYVEDLALLEAIQVGGTSAKVTASRTI